MSDLTVRELSELTGLSLPMVRPRLQGLPTKPGKNNAVLYDYREALRALYVTDSGGDDLDLSQERARLAKAQANITEMQEQELRGELVRSNEVIGYWQAIITNAKTQLL